MTDRGDLPGPEECGWGETYPGVGKAAGCNLARDGKVRRLRPSYPALRHVDEVSTGVTYPAPRSPTRCGSLPGDEKDAMGATDLPGPETCGWGATVEKSRRGANRLPGAEKLGGVRPLTP